jgi:hypothetical protein
MESTGYLRNRKIVDGQNKRSKVTNILFIGNSFTQRNNLPGCWLRWRQRRICASNTN